MTPGTVLVGEWAHVKYNKRQHLVVADEPAIDEAEPVRFRCGHRTFTDAVWHDAAKPHLPKCKRCQRPEDADESFTNKVSIGPPAPERILL